MNFRSSVKNAAQSKTWIVVLVICVVHLYRWGMVASDHFIDTDLGNWVHNAKNLLTGRPLITDDHSWVYMSPFSTVNYYLSGRFFGIDGPLWHVPLTSIDAPPDPSVNFSFKLYSWMYLPSYLMGLVFIMCSYFTIRRLFSFFTSIVVVLALVFDGRVRQYTLNGMTEMQVMGFFQASFLCFIMAIYSTHIRRQKFLGYLSIFLFVLSFLTKPTALFGVVYLLLAHLLFHPAASWESFQWSQPLFVQKIMRKWHSGEFEKIWPHIFVLSVGVILIFISRSFILHLIESPDYMSFRDVAFAQASMEFPLRRDLMWVNFVKNLIQVKNSLFYIDRMSTVAPLFVILFFTMATSSRFRGQTNFKALIKKDWILLIGRVLFFLIPILVVLPLNFITDRRTSMFLPGIAFASASMFEKMSWRTMQDVQFTNSGRIQKILMSLFSAIFMFGYICLRMKDDQLPSSALEMFQYGKTLLMLLIIMGVPLSILWLVIESIFQFNFGAFVGALFVALDFFHPYFKNWSKYGAGLASLDVWSASPYLILCFCISLPMLKPNRVWTVVIVCLLIGFGVTTEVTTRANVSYETMQMAVNEAQSLKNELHPNCVLVGDGQPAYFVAALGRFQGVESWHPQAEVERHEFENHRMTLYGSGYPFWGQFNAHWVEKHPKICMKIKK